MDVRRRSRVLGAILLVGLAPALLAQETPAPAPTPALSPEALEAFLLKARVSRRSISPSRSSKPGATPS